MDEEQIIRVLWRYLSSTLSPEERRQSRGMDPFSDDGSWFQNSKRRRLIFFKTDMMVSSTDAPPSMSVMQMAAKAITGCVSDFAAKGIQPSYGLLSLALPSRYADLKSIRQLGRGFRDSAREYGLKIIGGDTNESVNEELVIDVSLTGFGDAIVKRSGARPGDFLGVSGDFGLEPIGLQILLENNLKFGNLNMRKKAIDAILKPRAKLSLGLAISKYISTSIDSSDGLAISLYHLAEASNVDLLLDRLPVAKGVEEFAEKHSQSVYDLVLFGGEEYQLVVTFDEKYLDQLAELGIKTIGRVRSPMKRSRPVVYFNGKKIERKGWLHLQRK